MAENPQPVVRLDKSRPFSTVHGERLPGDRHANVFFYQHGLPFNAQEELIADHPEIAEDKSGEKQEKVARLLARAAKFAAAAKAAPKPKKSALLDDELEDEDEDEDAEELPPINLSAWARGEQQLEWQLVTNAIAQRFAVRVKDKRGAIELLVAEKVVSTGELSEKHLKLIQQD